MCGPLAIPLAIASAAVTAGGQLYSGFAQAGQAKYQAGIDRQNAGLEAEAAKTTEANTATAAQRRYRQGGQLAGEQQATMAANGIDLGFGSAAQVQTDTASITNEDVTSIYQQGYQQSRGHIINVGNYLADANAQMAKAKALKVGSIISAAGTALGAASQISGMKSTPKAS